MSRQLALDTICLKPTPRLAHTEYSMEYHKEYLRKVTGFAPEDPRCVPAFYKAWDFDMLWCVDDGLYRDWSRRGRVTNMGHAVYAADGSDLHAATASPFTEIEEVWAFDAVAEYGLPSFDDQVRAYSDFVTTTRRDRPDQLVTGGYYHTVMSGAIAAFGWEMLLLGASNLARMEKVFDSFFRRTMFHMQAWAKTDIDVVIQHDDFVWSAGPFLDPAFYRKAIIPRYAELWKPLHAAGKKVIFCSDGTFTMFADDIANAGADGFSFEPSNDFGFMAERFGSSHALIGSAVDCRDMAFAPWETVKATMDRTFELASHCRGVVFAVGNHIPANVPDEMLERYIGHLKSHWQR